MIGSYPMVERTENEESSILAEEKVRTIFKS